MVMRRDKILILVIFIAWFSTCQAQTRAEKRAAKEAEIEAQVKTSIESNHINIIIDRIIPAKDPARSTLDGYSLKISNDTLNCYLPYIGQMRSSMFDPGEMSIVFKDQKITLFKAIGKKGIYLIAFETKSAKNLEGFLFNIEIYPNGSANIGVAPHGRDQIAYHGELKY